MPCRCLLPEKWPDLAKTIQEYVDSLPETVRAPEAVYRQRLNQCTACDKLTDGTCMLCGCYVEARAAKQSLACPAVPPKWK